MTVHTFGLTKAVVAGAIGALVAGLLAVPLAGSASALPIAGTPATQNACAAPAPG